MRQLDKLSKFFLMGIGLSLIFSGCVRSERPVEESKPADQPQMRITMIEAYQGVKDGNTESVQLPTDKAFITVKICLENLSTVQESVYWPDVFLDLGDNIRITPVALGYDQAEAFNWLLPIAAPVGAKSIDHKFYFFLIQKDELISVPANQSLGCENSPQFKSLALLFMVKKERVGDPHLLRFLGATIPFTAKKDSPLIGYAKWGAGLGGAIVLMAFTLVLMRKRKLKSQPSTDIQPDEDFAGEA